MENLLILSRSFQDIRKDDRTIDEPRPHIELEKERKFQNIMVFISSTT